MDSMDCPSEEHPSDEVRMHQYDQVCTSYHKIDEFRGKLLTLWPILGGAAGGVALLLTDDASGGHLLALGIFGAVVSLGVA